MLHYCAVCTLISLSVHAINVLYAIIIQDPLYAEALEVQRRVLGPDHPDTLLAVNNMAVLCYKKHDFAVAKTLMKEAASGRKRILVSRKRIPWLTFDSSSPPPPPPPPPLHFTRYYSNTSCQCTQCDSLAQQRSSHSTHTVAHIAHIARSDCIVPSALCSHLRCCVSVSLSLCIYSYIHYVRTFLCHVIS